jgi:hypothetical protein
MKNMNTPRTRAEFERNFNLLHRQIKDGRFHIAQGLLRSLDGLTRVRFLPNGRIDFLSVDETARLQANMMNQFSDESFQEHFKKHTSPSDVSTAAKKGEPQPAGSDGPSDTVD